MVLLEKMKKKLVKKSFTQINSLIFCINLLKDKIFLESRRKLHPLGRLGASDDVIIINEFT